MNRTALITITIAVAGIAACVVLVTQESKNRWLRDNITNERESIEALERELQQIAPLTSLGEAKRSLPAAAGSQSEVVAQAQAGSSESAASSARVERTRAQIDRLVEGLGVMDRSPAQFFKILPDILRIIQDLSIAEMIAVAEGIDTPGGMGDADGRAVARMVLLLLAAEEDPLRVMNHSELMSDREIRTSLLGQLAKHDPTKAREWVKGSDLTQEEKEEFRSLLIFRTLRRDVGAGLEMLREMRDGGGQGSRGFGRVSQLPMPTELVPDLVQAYNDPGNLDLRREIRGMILRTSAMDGGVAATRAATGQLDMSPQELSNFFVREFDDSIRAEPEAALAWMEEALDKEWQQRTIPSAISTWANHNFNTAAEYLGKMEPSKTKDSAVGQFAQTVVSIDPKAAAVWSLQIADEQMRKETVQSVTAQWRSQDAEAAGAWLEENGEAEE